MNFDIKVQTLGKNEKTYNKPESHQKIFGDQWETFTKKKTQPHEYLKKIRYYLKTLTDIKIEKISLKLGGEVASLEDITSKIKPIEDFVFKTGKDLSMLYCKTDTLRRCRVKS